MADFLANRSRIFVTGSAETVCARVPAESGWPLCGARSEPKTFRKEGLERTARRTACALPAWAPQSWILSGVYFHGAERAG